MKEGELIQFPTQTKKITKAETFVEDKINEDRDFLKRLTRGEANEFVLKWAWVVEKLHDLKLKDPQAIKRNNIQIRREQLVRGSSPDELKKNIIFIKDMSDSSQKEISLENLTGELKC